MGSERCFFSECRNLETKEIEEHAAYARTKKDEEKTDRSVRQDRLGWQKNPDTALLAGLWLPKQQWLLYDCQTFSLEEDGGNYTVTLPVGRDSNCCRLLNKIWLNVGFLKEEVELPLSGCTEWMSFWLTICSLHPDCCFMPRSSRTRQMWLAMN